MKRVMWGVLSTARIGRLAVIPAIQRSTNGTVLAIASRYQDGARMVAAEFSIPRAYGSYQALLEDPDIDAVYIPLPNSLHCEWAVRAAEAGKHVLCEKPLALTAAGCEDMIAACQACGVWLMEAFMYRFHPQHTLVQELTSSGVIGQVQFIRAGFSFPLTDLQDIRMQKELGGGALMDLGCYCVSVSRLIAGVEPVETQAMANFDQKSGIDETLVGILRFPKGKFAVFECSFCATFGQFYQVVGADGEIDVPSPFRCGLENVHVHVSHGGETETITIPGVDQYQLMVEHFADCVHTCQAPRFPASDSQDNMKVIEALLESAQSGRPVPLIPEG